MSNAAKKQPYDSAEQLLKFKSTKTKAKKDNSCYYRVANHLELFKIGKSFFEDYEKGYKSFAISSTGYHSSQQQTILGIASFFDYNCDDVNILIISNNIFDGIYKELIESSSFNEVTFKDSHYTCDVHSFHEHFDFLDFQALVETFKKEESPDHEKVLDLLFKSYDLIFWDVPELNLIKESPSIYYPVISHFDCLSIVVSNNVSRVKDVEQIGDFFSSYGLSLKGLLVDSVEMKETIKGSRNKSWWRGWFK